MITADLPCGPRNSLPDTFGASFEYTGNLIIRQRGQCAKKIQKPGFVVEAVRDGGQAVVALGRILGFRRIADHAMTHGCHHGAVLAGDRFG